jgi:hypothetical protein
MSFVSISRQEALPIAYGEPYWDNLRELLQEGQVDRFAHSASLWGALPQDHPEFMPALITAITEMEKKWPV